MALIQSGDNLGVNLKLNNNGAAMVTLVDQYGSEFTATNNTQGSALQADGSVGIISMGINDGVIKAVRTDRLGSTSIASHIPLLIDSFEGTAIHPVRWTNVATTMAVTISPVNGVTFNSANITTINTGYSIFSAKRFPKIMRAPLHAKFRCRINAVANSVAQIGLGDATTFNGANTTGAYWEKSASGALVPVLVFNSSVLTGDDVSSIVSVSEFYTYDIILDDDEAVYIIQNASNGLIISRQRISLPQTAQRLLSTSQISGMARLYNTGTAPASAPLMVLSDFNVLLLDINQNKAWRDVSASLNRSIVENPFTGAQLAAWANSAEPASGVLSNTAAAYTSLGGKFQFAAVAGAITDFALFGFQVPAPSNFVITGVAIEAWVTGAAIATTPTLLTWALGVGSTGVSLATATVQRIGLGAQTLPVGAAIGTCAVPVIRSFNTPFYCASGRFIHVILRIPVSTATASQVIAGMVNFEGYTE